MSSCVRITRVAKKKRIITAGLRRMYFQVYMLTGNSKLQFNVRDKAYDWAGSKLKSVTYFTP